MLSRVFKVCCYQNILNVRNAYYIMISYIKDGRNRREWTLDLKVCIETRLSCLKFLFKVNFVYICFL